MALAEEIPQAGKPQLGVGGLSRAVAQSSSCLSLPGECCSETDTGSKQNKEQRASLSNGVLNISNKKGGRAMCGDPMLSGLAGETVQDGHYLEFGVQPSRVNKLSVNGMEELHTLLAGPVPESTPPSQNLLGSPPKREEGAANPLSHCSSWTRMASISSRSNLEMLDRIHGDPNATAMKKGEQVARLGRDSNANQEFEEQRGQDDSKKPGKSNAIPVPSASRCSSVHWMPCSSSPETEILA
jgi:hypothetical protein